MKPTSLLHLFAVLAAGVSSHAGEAELKLRVHPEKIRARWTLPPADTLHALTTRRWQLESSADLMHWAPEGPAVVAVPGGPGMTAADVSRNGPGRYFRLRVVDTPVYLAKNGGESLGYVSEMDARMAANAGAEPASVPQLYPSAACLPQVSYDVSTAEYWEQWNTDPVVWNAAQPANSPDRRQWDFRLNVVEQTLLDRNGFVVSEARGSTSFTDLYYRIWMDDLPVYVSSDSILHAWHRTWITMLEELEELALRPRLKRLLEGVNNHLGGQLSAMEDHWLYENGPPPPPILEQAINDAFVCTGPALGLLDYMGTPPAPSADSWFGRAVAAQTVSMTESFFGGTRIVDWTMFAPRAHYTNSETLKGYFRAMMWLGQIDLRLDERAAAPGNEPRQLAAACVLTLALRDAGLMDEWREIDAILAPFMGRTDALTPPQLLELLDEAGIASFSDFAGFEKTEALLGLLKSGTAGLQQITGHPIPAPLSESKLVLPRSFAVFPQRFTPESWALTRMVFDNIWRENPDISGPPMVRVRRRLPSALDINFAVMGNNTPAAALSGRMTMTDGVPFRDGYDYAGELLSVRQVMDAAGPAAWSGSLYLHSLDTLRSLSAPLPATVPEAMRTEAWKWKTVHTQLAGWTELRHDNLLYAKQSYTPPVTCDYPAGYVEPRPEFYAAMKRLVDFAHSTLMALPMSGTVYVRPALEPPLGKEINLALRKADWLAHLNSMSLTMEKLGGIAGKEVLQESFTLEQTDFLRSLVQGTEFPYVTGRRTYSGWYPRLYLESVFAGVSDFHPSELWDPLVADIHTDGPDAAAGDPGAVLYNATGNAGFMLVCIDVNGRLCLHGGPVFTYYEFTRGLNQPRLTDQTWKAEVRAKTQPAHPAWTASFLVPGPIDVPSVHK